MALSNYPLSWPDGWQRTPNSQVKNARFLRNHQMPSIMEGLNRVLRELAAMGIAKDDVLVSTNVPTRLDGMPRSDQREPNDSGVAVYWRKKHDAPMQCIAIDIYSRVADNLCAVAATLEALRAIERHGGAQVQERSSRGFAALPEKTKRSWRDVMLFEQNESVSDYAIATRYRTLAKTRHPDAGGSEDAMAELNVAREEALREISSAA